MEAVPESILSRVNNKTVSHQAIIGQLRQAPVLLLLLLLLLLLPGLIIPRLTWIYSLYFTSDVGILDTNY